MARTFSANQNTIAASEFKEVSWAIKVVDVAGSPVTHYWSTKDISYGGNSYTFKIIPESFAGITMNRAKSELGIQAPNDLKFEVTNSDSALDESDFPGGS